MARQQVSNYVHLDQLSGREKDFLIDSLKAIDDFVKRIRSSFIGGFF